MDLHLNVSGGLTGDMFIAAVLDAFPQFEQPVLDAIDALDAPYPVNCSLVAHSDVELSGHRFEIEPFDKYFGRIPIVFSAPATWASVHERLAAADVSAGVRMHATKIFELAVMSESAARGISPEQVTFEPGAWKSLAQVAGAAALIDALVTARWSASAIPPGEAVTLIGAAIVDYLCPPRTRVQPLPKILSMVRSGTGFGFLNPRNHIRLLCFDSDDAAQAKRDDGPAPRRETLRSGQQTRQ